MAYINHNVVTRIINACNNIVINISITQFELSGSGKHLRQP